jgi:hypothetical protein
MNLKLYFNLLITINCLLIIKNYEIGEEDEGEDADSTSTITFNLSDDLPIGTVIGTLDGAAKSVQNADSSFNFKSPFYIVPVIPEDINKFKQVISIDIDTGVMKLNSRLNYNRQNIYKFSVLSISEGSALIIILNITKPLYKEIIIPTTTPATSTSTSTPLTTFKLTTTIKNECKHNETAQILPNFSCSNETTTTTTAVKNLKELESFGILRNSDSNNDTISILNEFLKSSKLLSISLIILISLIIIIVYVIVLFNYQNTNDNDNNETIMSSQNLPLDNKGTTFKDTIYNYINSNKASSTICNKKKMKENDSKSEMSSSLSISNSNSNKFNTIDTNLNSKQQQLVGDRKFTYSDGYLNDLGINMMIPNCLQQGNDCKSYDNSSYSIKQCLSTATTVTALASDEIMQNDNVKCFNHFYNADSNDNNTITLQQWTNLLDWMPNYYYFSNVFEDLSNLEDE